MRFYETTIVLSPQSDDAAIGHEIDKITQTIVADSGRLVDTHRWGVKRMAYPIQKHTQGQYIHFVYQAPPTVPGKLESAFRINENVLRHLTVLVEGPLNPGGSNHAAAATEQEAETSAARPAGETTLAKEEAKTPAEPVAAAVSESDGTDAEKAEEESDEEK